MSAAPAGERIAILDVIRGVAILAIVLMNVPWQAASIPLMLQDVRQLGWSPADRATWIALDVLVAGTQRALLEMLFGAGIVLLSSRLGFRAYARRNMALLAFGVADIVLLLWIGDILAAYAIAGLIAFSLRGLETRTLVGLGLGFALWSAAYGAAAYAGQVSFDAAVAEAERAGTPTVGQARTLRLAEEDDARRARLAADTARLVAEETRAHADGRAYIRWYWRLWARYNLHDWLFVETVLEAAATMLLGMALFRAGVIQGARSGRVYLCMMIACYAIGLTWRSVSAMEVATGMDGARIGWIVAEPARLLVGLGHLSAIILAWRTAVGRALLRPFQSAGRTALSLYLVAQALGLHFLFAPYGLDLWERYGWAGMTMIATLFAMTLLAISHMWARCVGQGPVERIWRMVS